MRGRHLCTKNLKSSEIVTYFSEKNTPLDNKGDMRAIRWSGDDEIDRVRGAVSIDEGYTDEDYFCKYFI